MVVLGLGGSGHDWSSCAIDGTRLVAVDEERIVRKKYGVGTDLLAGLSRRAVLGEFGLSGADVFQAVACDLVPRPFYYPYRGRLCVINHHLAHAYSAFPASGFTEAAVLVCDNSGSLLRGSKSGRGAMEAETISYFMADRHGVRLLDRVSGAHHVEGTTERDYYQPGITDNSLGHFYRAASIAVGLSYQSPSSPFPISEDGKTMGLASYGDTRFVDDVADLVTLQPGGGVQIIAEKVTETFERLTRDADFEQRAAVAYAAQHVLEEALLHCARALHARTGARNLCIAGGVGLNSVANGRILRETPFEHVFIVPAAGDNGISLGCAYYGLHKFAGTDIADLPALTDAYLGPAYPEQRLAAAITASGLTEQHPDDLPDTVAGLLAAGRTVGWFDGRSEFGPRALGHRSILTAPAPAAMRDYLNDEVKHREWFRPYAPIVPVDDAAEYFDISQPSPYMLIVVGVKRPDLMPAITHVDGTARLQTLDQAANPGVYQVLRSFEARTGYPVVLNTSFNVAGEPIVETPEDAINAFTAMPLDHLVLDGRLLSKDARLGKEQR
jgi:carbamoyltransferase